ncbi:hypothetical protein N8561_00950 [bacterium]|nr:hypothetical protein [bacterium]
MTSPNWRATTIKTNKTSSQYPLMGYLFHENAGTSCKEKFYFATSIDSAQEQPRSHKIKGPSIDDMNFAETADGKCSEKLEQISESRTHTQFFGLR